MPQSFTYDVFLSHSSADKPIVKKLAERLRGDGLRVWLDEWEIHPGDLFGLKVERGLEESRALVLVMSANAFASDWVTLERQTALFRDPTNAQRRFIPVLRDNCEIKDTLKQYLFIDWREQSEEQYAKLLVACRPLVADETTASLPIHVLEAHDAFVWGVAVTPGGERAASGSADSTIKVWDLQSRNQIATLKGHFAGVPGVALTADGKWLVSGSHDRSVRLWDLRSKKEIAVFWGHEDPVVRVAVTPDGTRAVSASQDGTIRIWDLIEQRLVGILAGHSGGAFAVAIAANGQVILSGADDHTVRVWDVNSNTCTRILQGHTRAVCGVAASVLVSAVPGERRTKACGTALSWGSVTWPVISPAAQTERLKSARAK